jgi:hypothetical protein
MIDPEGLNLRVAVTWTRTCLFLLPTTGRRDGLRSLRFLPSAYLAHGQQLSHILDRPGDDAALTAAQVEGVVKQYPRRIFGGSPIFADMLALPQPTGQPVEGTSQEHPLRLDGVQLKEIGQFACVVECWSAACP